MFKHETVTFYTLYEMFIKAWYLSLESLYLLLPNRSRYMGHHRNRLRKRYASSLRHIGLTVLASRGISCWLDVDLMIRFCGIHMLCCEQGPFLNLYTF